MAAGAACPGLAGMGDSGGEPTDRPKTRGAKRQHRMFSVPELLPLERALPSAILADECALCVCHSAGLSISPIGIKSSGMSAFLHPPPLGLGILVWASAWLMCGA